MKKKVVVLSVLLCSAVLAYLLLAGTIETRENRLPEGIYRGVCWTGEPRVLPPDAVDIAKANGIQWISQTPFGWMQTQRTPHVNFNTHHGWWGETDEGIRVTTREAHKKGIKVMLKPHIWISRPVDNGWRSSIDFQNEEEWKKWEADYSRFILHYARIAKEEKIAMLCIGTEFTTPVLKRSRYWKDLIAKIRDIYPGKLTYAANWYQEFQNTNIWKHLDYISIQCYFPLTQKENPTIQEIVAGWQPHIKAIGEVSEKYGKPVLLTEIGYTNTRGATIKPWEWSQRIPRDRLENQEQANAFEAMFRALAKQKWLAGIFIWKWFPTHQRIRPDRIDFSPQNKPAGEVMKKWYLNP